MGVGMELDDALNLEVALKEDFERLVQARGPTLSVPLVPGLVLLEGSYPETSIVVTLKSSERPGCIYGYRAAIWDEGLGSLGVERLSTYFWLDIEECVEAVDLGLPRDCLPGQTIWLKED